MASSSDGSDELSFDVAALEAGVKLQAGKTIKISVRGISGKPLSGSGSAKLKSRNDSDDSGAGTAGGGGDPAGGPEIVADGDPTGSDASGDATADGSGAGSTDGSGDASGAGSGDATGPGMDIEWTFVNPDGTPIADSPCTIIADDGTTLQGQIAGGVLKMHVPDGHLIVEVDGHIIGDVDTGDGSGSDGSGDDEASADATSSADPSSDGTGN